MADGTANRRRGGRSWPDEAPAPTAAPGEVPGAARRFPLEVAFAIGVVLAVVVIGAWLMSMPTRLPHPDDVLLPAHGQTATPLAKPTRDPFSAGSAPRPTATVAPGSRMPATAAPTAPASTRAPVAGGGSPARPSHPVRPRPTSKPSAPAAPVVPVAPVVPAPPVVTVPPLVQPPLRCVVNLLGIRICLPG